MCLLGCSGSQSENDGCGVEFNGGGERESGTCICQATLGKSKVASHGERERIANTTRTAALIDAQPLILNLPPAVRSPQYLMPPIALLIDLQTARKSYQLSQALPPRTRGQHDFRQPALPARHLPRKRRYAAHNTLPLSRGQRREGTYSCETKGRPCWQS